MNSLKRQSRRTNPDHCEAERPNRSKAFLKTNRRPDPNGYLSVLTVIRDRWQCVISDLVDLLPPSPQDDEGNLVYLIRRAALGDNPTHEEMDAVVAYGLEIFLIFITG